jgi:hypothetical protein
MPDLSKLLGDVYDAPTTTVTDVAYRPASPNGNPGPDWADDDRLDRAFAGWTPGPSADAPAAERRMFDGADERPAPLADDLAAALSEAVLAEKSDEESSPRPTDAAPAMTATAFGALTTDTPPRPAVTVPVPVETAPDVPAPDVPAPHVPADAFADAAVEFDEPVGRTSGAWQRADDDILPNGGKAKFSLSLRRR